MRALISGRLIALDKCPGVRPIGIGECLRRIICKSVAEFTKIELEETCSTDQLACGLKAGVEGAIHALSDIFDENKEEGCGMLLMDASNGFNSLWNVVKQGCGMLEYCGLGALDFSSKLTEVSRRFSLLAPMK